MTEVFQILEALESSKQKGENMADYSDKLNSIIAALSSIADAIDFNTRQAHYDALVANGEMWYCVLCERYFSYINTQPVLIGADNHKKEVCLDCLRGMNQQNNATNQKEQSSN